MYGIGTRSYNRSTERRQMKQECAKFTAKFERGEVKFAVVEIPVCTCRSFRFAHNPERHKELLSDHDWRLPSERRGMELFQERVR